MDNGRTPSAGRCAMDNQATEDHEMMVEWLVTSAMRLREERHLRTAMAGMGEWSGRGWVLELGPGALKCVRGNIGVAMERRTIG
jgi:hypothetical protein